MNWFSPISSMHVIKRSGAPSRDVREQRDRKFSRYLSIGLSQRDIAKRLGISRTAVQKRMRKS